jgi:hypothetical protein
LILRAALAGKMLNEVTPAAQIAADAIVVRLINCLRVMVFGLFAMFSSSFLLLCYS